MARNYAKIAKEIAKTGFFSEYLPPCFSLKDKALTIFPSSGCDLIAPYSFTMSRYNGNDSRRTIFIPEIGAYLTTFAYMRDHNIFKELIEFTEANEHSYSPILGTDNSIVRHEQSYGGSSNSTDADKSNYISNISKKIIYASGAKKILKLDISNCYASFYMHMMPAILLKAEGAEENYNKFIKNSEDTTVSSTYITYKGLDEAIRRQNLNRTNGLLTGTLFSKIIAEAILTRIDKELEAEGLKFVRYVDDYEVFLHDDNEKAAISKFSMILKKYGFSLNSEKTEIVDFPYYMVENFEKILKTTTERTMDSARVMEIFNTFFGIEKNGTKGAIRYLLKSFEHNPPAITDTELYKAYLITIMANNERSLTKSCSILINRQDEYILNETDVKNIIVLLKNHVMCQHDLEVIWLLYLLIQTGNIAQGDEVIADIVATDNELAHGMLLQKNLLNQEELDCVKENATSWLLLFELFSDDVITEEEFIDRLSLNKNLNMYKKLKENHIHFISF